VWSRIPYPINLMITTSWADRAILPFREGELRAVSRSIGLTGCQKRRRLI